MGFGKAFIVGLILLMALTFVFALLISALGGGIGTFFGSLVNPLSNLSSALVGTVQVTPTILFGGLMLAIAFGSLDLIMMLTILAPLIVMLISAIVVGKLAEGKGAAFGAWFLICIIATVLSLVFTIIGGSAIEMLSIIIFLIPAIINGIFYGAFALLASGSEYY